MKVEVIRQSVLSLIPLSYISFHDVMDGLQQTLGVLVLVAQGAYLIWKWHRESKTKTDDTGDDIIP